MQKDTNNFSNIRKTRSMTLKENLSKVSKKTPSFSESIQSIQKSIQPHLLSTFTDNNTNNNPQISSTSSNSFQSFSNIQTSTPSEDVSVSPVEQSSVATQSSQSSIPTNLSNLSKKISNANVTPL
ncbi:hypothetical protein CANARDRAFT_28705, partial [[Candida] arabinofermentans NRRL YB-2248]